MEETLKRRILRRETHSSRSGAVVLIALIGLAVLIWLAVELIVQVLGLRAVLIGPSRATGYVVNLLAAPPTWAWAIGLGATVCGLLALGGAVLPGRRGKRKLPSQALAVVATDDVLAGLLAHRAATHCGLDVRQVRVGLTRRVADVRLTPTSGSPIDINDVRAALAAALDEADVEPTPRLTVRVSKEGVLRP